jgi:hypothetical protein
MHCEHINILLPLIITLIGCCILMLPCHGVRTFVSTHRYEKFKRGHIDEDDANSPSCTGDVKYIILDDLEYQDEFEEEDT